MCIYIELLFVYIFFFFKQKTAYEMRISDWSSDVCSSDLHALLVARGARMTPAAIALAIMGGHGTVPVHRRTRIALISTGDELAAPGAMTGPHQIPESNGPMLAAMLRSTGCDVDDMGVVGDDLDSIKGAVDAARRNDVILTIGGASVGDPDLVKPAFLACGATLDFIKVALKPGKPLMERSEESRGGKEGVSTGRSRRSPDY